MTYLQRGQPIAGIPRSRHSPPVLQRLKRVVFCRFALTVARQHSGNELLRQVNGQYERVAVTGIRGLMAFTDRVL